MSKVLIIDDDVILSGLFQDYLEEEKFQVRTADTATEGLQLALQGEFDIVILDVMLRI